MENKKDDILHNELETYQIHLKELTTILTTTFKDSPDLAVVMANVSLLTIQIKALTRYFATTGMIDGALYAKITNEVFNEITKELLDIREKKGR